MISIHFEVTSIQVNGLHCYCSLMIVTSYRSNFFTNTQYLLYM